MNFHNTEHIQIEMTIIFFSCFVLVLPLLPSACPDSCLTQCHLVLYQRSISGVFGLMLQPRMPSGCPLCPWA